MSWKYYSVQSLNSFKKESKQRATWFSEKILNFSFFCYFRNAPGSKVSYAGFASQVFCSYDNVLVDGYVESKFTVIFIFESL